jgi:hypothetical protein
MGRAERAASQSVAQKQWKTMSFFAFLFVLTTLSSASGPAIAGQENAFEQRVRQQIVPSNRDDAMLLAYELRDAKAPVLAIDLTNYVRRRDIQALRGKVLPTVTVEEAVKGPYGGYNLHNELGVDSARFIADAITIDFTASFPDPPRPGFGQGHAPPIALIPGLWTSTQVSKNDPAAATPPTWVDTQVESHLKYKSSVVIDVSLLGASLKCPETVIEAGSTIRLTCPVEWRPQSTENYPVRPDPYAVLMNLKQKGATAAQVSILLWAGTPPRYVATTWDSAYMNARFRDLDLRRRASAAVASLGCVETGSCPVPVNTRPDYRAQWFLAAIAFIMALPIALRLLQRRSGAVDGWPWWIARTYVGLAVAAVLLHLVDNPTHASPQSPWTGLFSSAVLMILDLPWTLVLLTGSTQNGFITRSDSPALLIFLALNVAFLFAMSAIRSPRP